MTLFPRLYGQLSLAINAHYEFGTTPTETQVSKINKGNVLWIIRSQQFRLKWLKINSNFPLRIKITWFQIGKCKPIFLESENNGLILG